jgi:hypothetical protein
MNARGILTKDGRPWGRGSFRALLTNERYTGVYIYDDVRIEGGVPQIIGKELFYKMQEILRTKKNPQCGGRHQVNGDYLLTGKLFCGKCKSPMIGVSGTSASGKLYYYYACQKRRSEKSCDKDQEVRDRIENAVAVAVRNYVLQDKVIAWIATNTVEFGKKYKEHSPVPDLEDRLAENKCAIKNILNAIEQGIILPTTKERLTELEEESAKLEGRLAVEKSAVPEVSRERVIGWLESFRDGDVSDKKYLKRLFNAFLVAVYLYDDHMEIVFGGSDNPVRFRLDSGPPESSENIPNECSYRLGSGAPKNPPPIDTAKIQRFVAMGGFFSP